jgi:hypothetical protein
MKPTRRTQLALLRSRRQWPHRRAAEPRDELPTFH